MRIMALNQMPEDTRDPDYHPRIESKLRAYASPGTEVELCYPDDYPGAAISDVMSAQDQHTEIHYLISVPALVRKILWAETQGFDAVIQTNAFEPGVDAARQAVRIPVIGLCRSAMIVATSIAERIAITVPFDGYVLHTRRMLRLQGLDGRVVDIRSLRLPGIPRGAAVAEGRARLQAAAVALMRDIVRESGAECIVPLGAAVVPYILEPADLEREVGVPVLNPTAIGMHFAEMAVRFGLTGRVHSLPA